METTITFSIATEFSETPGARYRTDGKFSGEEFYDDKLKALFKKCLDSNSKLIINIDGTNGYATSFLDETFGRLAQDYGVDEVNSRLSFISEEEPYLIEEIKEYIKNAHK